MDPEVTIFSSVFRSILESFSPSLIQIISEYERRSLLGSKVSDNIIMLFKHLPRGLPTYVKILEDLTSVSTSNPPKILHFLCKLIKNTITGKTTGIMPLSSPAFNAGNHEHQLIYYYFSLFLLSDLIYRISINADVYMASGPIISTGYFIASKLHNINEVDNIIVNQWAVIFSITSEFSCSDITDLFGDFDDPERGFRIIQYSRLDYDKDNAIKFFNDTIIPEMIKLYKKKSLTSSIFRSISSLLLCIPCNEDIYSKIFEIAYHKKFINEDNEGSIILCLMILQRHPRKKNMLEHFAQKRIFSKSVTPEKLLFSLWGFRVFMFGKNLDPSWYFWEWGNDEKIDRLCYLKWNSMIELQTDSHYFKNLFMTHYFHSLNYNLNHEQISQLTSIIAHIASMDLSLFISDIIPSFLKLRENDSRLIAFVSALSIINSNSFKQFSSCTINSTILTKLNSSIRPKLLQIFLNYNNIEVESLDLENSQKHTDHVPYEMHELITLSQLRESDKKILEILEHLHIHYYIKLSNMLSPSEYIDNDLSIYSYLIETLNDLFTDEDFETPDILRTLIKMSINKNRKLSNIAYLLCKEILSTQINNLMAIETILSCVKRNISSEHLYVTMSLLLYGLTFSDISKIPYHLLMEIEINAFYGLCTEFPLLRNISYLVLKKLNHALHNKGIINYIQSNLEEIEKNVKIRVMSHQESNNAADFVLHELSHEISNKSDSFYKLSQNIFYNLNSNQKNKVFSNMPVSEVNIKLEICLSSHYYDIWLHFIKEILNLMIEINYTPILEKIAENREELIHFLVDQTNISSLGMIMTYTSSLYQLSLLKKFKKLDKEPFSEYDSQKSGKLLFHIRRFVKKLANSNDDRKNDISLFIIKNSHFSILPRLLTALAKAPINIYEKVIETTLFILKSPEITQEFIKTYIKKFILIMSNSQYTIQNWKLNETRFINWSDESEQSIIKHRKMLSNFCNICYMILINGPSHFSDSIFPYEIRYVTARFFYNWTQTKSDMLSNLRFVSKRSLSSLIKIGPIFGGNMKFDECPIKLFGEMESEGFQILNVLLQNHYNVLIKQFISTIYSQPYPTAKLFFNAIIENLSIDNAEKSSLVSGQLILLGLVTSQIKLPNYYTFLCKLFEIIGPINNVEHSDTIIDTMRQVSPLEIIPIYFKYATEAVFHSFFKLINKQNIFPPIKDIVSCVIPWIQHIRLLPSQLTCTPGIPNTFAYFTPYQFLENLIIICENISDSDFEYIASMWSELMKSPDHKQMVPLFISSWPNESVKQKLYSSLIDSHPYDMSRRLIINLGFSYYFHVTFNQKRNFDDELWICPLILNSIKNNWLELKENLPAMIHFSLLYREKVPSLFAMICSKLKVEYPDTKLEITHLKKTIQQFIYSLDMEQNMESNPDDNQEDSNSKPHLKKDLSGKQIKNDKINLLVKWCDESLKWTFGSPNTMFCASSLYIFNKINEIKPNLLQIDKNFLIALMRITSFHLSNNENNDNNSFLSLLVNETIEIFKQNYSKDPYLAYNFCTCFLDCRVFVYGDSLITALPIFKAAMNDPDLMPKISITAISIIRPTIPKLEHSHFCRYQLCEMIKVIKSDEMLMITVPLKNLNSSYFHELISSEKIVERSSVSALCKSLDNYAMMASTASISLLNCIFEIAAYVVEQVIDENNRVPLVKIYSKALTNISRCPNSIIFIKTISERQPGIISTGIIDVFEWDRMLDFVMNSLNQLLPKNSFTPSKITDVPNFKIVENFLFCDTPPKILPFDAECELISNISCLKQPQEWHQQKIENSLRLNKQNENKKLSSFIEQEITTPQSSPLNSSSYSYEESWGPLLHPIALILNSHLMKC